MNQRIISTFEQFHETVQDYDPNRDVFRGVLRDSYDLIPKLGRKEIQFLSDTFVVEKEMLRLFKNYGHPYLPGVNLTDWELLAVAQHHGLPTRLLDWSRNPLVAAYFAVEKEIKTEDSAIYVLRDQIFIDTELYKPFEVKEVSKFLPSHITPRITAQSGLFTIHPDPRVPFSCSSLDKLVIVNSFRAKLKKMLYRYGVHRAALFPSLDGLATHIEWLKTASH